MMYTDRTMYLVVQSDLVVGFVRVARQLNAVHAKVRTAHARVIDVLGIDLRQRDECTAVFRPTLKLR